MTDLRVPFVVAQDAFGVDAVVTVDGAGPVETVAVWLPFITDDVPAGGDLTRREVRRVLALARADVPTLPRGTPIAAAPEAGAAVEQWLTEGPSMLEPDCIRVVVIPAP